MKRPPPSLKAQALAFLARREYSRAELRRKLLDAARRRARLAAGSDPGGAPPFDAESIGSAIDAALDELQAAHHLSDTRFAESRVHAREARHGTARIQQELARHGVELDTETLQRLRENELERARAIWQRRYGDTPTVEPAERARQMRFLASRGFASDVVRRVVGGIDD